MSTVEPDQVNTCVGIKPAKNPTLALSVQDKSAYVLVVLDSLMSFIRIIAMNQLTNLSSETSLSAHEQEARD